MPQGFYVTDKGIELINGAAQEGKKLQIRKAQFGDGANPQGDREYGITALKSKQYEKNFDVLTDSYEISSYDPKAFLIKVVVPEDVSCTINEVGFLDDEDNLIVYGIVQEKIKESGIKFQYENWVKFDNVDELALEIVINSPEFEKVEQLVEQVTQDFNLDNYVTNERYTALEEKVQEIENNKDGSVSEEKVAELESRIQSIEDNQDNYVTNDKYTALETKVNGHDTSITDLESSVSDLEDTVNTLDGTVSTLNGTVTTLDGTVDGLSGSVSTMTSDILSMKNDINDLKTKPSVPPDLEARVTAIETLLNGLQEALDQMI